MADPVLYPSLSELAAPVHKLAGIQVNPKTNGHHSRYGGTSPRIVAVNGGRTTPLNLPSDAEVLTVKWTADGQRVALIVRHADHIGLWISSVAGDLTKMEGIELNPLLGDPASWLPDQTRLLVRRIPQRGPAPQPLEMPVGPGILESIGGSARSTYEARNVLESAHDEALFEYYTTSELAIVDPETQAIEIIGEPAPYATAQFSPSGDYLLVERLVAPWSREVAWWRFAHDIDVWTATGEPVTTIASMPVADEVPVRGVPLGPRSVTWRTTAPHTLFWVEALDGGDPLAQVPHRDQLMRLAAPFTADPQVVFKAEHRISQGWGWSAEGNTLMLTQYEQERRWRHVWLLDVEAGTARLWFDLDTNDHYNDPGYPLFRMLPNGRYVMRQKGESVYFRGRGATEQGDRPFVDLRHLHTGETERLFRSAPNRYENFIAFADDENHFILRSESVEDVPNYYLATFREDLTRDGREGDGYEGNEPDAPRSLSQVAITDFTDPTPQLREIEKRIVRYERDDGVPLSFHLYLPPGYEEGMRLPTVLYAYPREFSDGTTAGQVTGSAQRFLRLYGASPLYFLLQGYAVLNRTTMPIIGDPLTAYDTFVPQLVANAEAAVEKAVELGIADPERIGIVGHSHGGLMVANLLAHTDLFRAGIARSGSYNKTTQPFGFQNERRSLFDARDAYIQLSPTFFADQVNEPILIIHGDEDSNPGTPTFQSEIFYEAVRGSGGTARLVVLPFEDHSYRARESIEHVLWEQLRWFDQYVKGDH
jgi:dipeptidyl aminopeptidase/acylaminoacyl peptidase